MWRAHQHVDCGDETLCAVAVRPSDTLMDGRKSVGRQGHQQE